MSSSQVGQQRDGAPLGQSVNEPGLCFGLKAHSWGGAQSPAGSSRRGSGESFQWSKESRGHAWRQLLLFQVSISAAFSPGSGGPGWRVFRLPSGMNGLTVERDARSHFLFSTRLCENLKRRVCFCRMWPALIFTLLSIQPGHGQVSTLFSFLKHRTFIDGS